MSAADFPPLKKHVQIKEDAPKDLGNSKPLSNTPPFETDGTRPKNFARDKQSFLEERAKHLQMPTAEEAELVPKYLFDDPVFIIHMCSSCRNMSRNLPAFNLDSEYQKIFGIETLPYLPCYI
ncbi:unnamed protein product [Caenorhabditis brenneri]